MENLDEKFDEVVKSDNEFSGGDQELATPMERFVAALIDGILVSAVSYIPFIGWLIGIAYFLLRDALPFLDGLSVGKKVMKIRAIDELTGEPLTEKYDKSAIRSVSLYIPIFGIIDAFMVFKEDRKRFGDQWAKTIVIKDPNA